MKQLTRRIAVFLLVLSMLGGYVEQPVAEAASKGITMNYSQYTLKKGKKVKLKVSGAKGKKVKWSTSNKKVAAVNASGTVKAKAKGTAKITAKVSGTKKKAVCKITVGVPVNKVSLAVNKITLKVGDSTQMQTTVLPYKATNKKLTYVSKNPQVAEISADGVITAKNVGSTKVIATAVDGSKKSAKLNVEVVAANVQNATNTAASTTSLTIPMTSTTASKPATTQQPTVAVQNVSVSPSQLAMQLQDEQQLTVSITPANATNKAVTYKVIEGSDVVSVDSKGLVKAIGAGVAKVKVITKDGAKEATCQITVTAPLRGLELTTKSGAEVIEAGTTDSIVVTPVPQEAEIASVTYTSSNETCASVSDEGVITAKKNGTVIITVKATDKEGKSAEQEIELRVGTHVTDVILSAQTLTMKQGEKTQLTAQVVPETANVQTVTYTVEDDKIATVSASGIVTAIAEGKTDITVTTDDGGKTKKCAVTVEKAGNVKTVATQEELTSALQETADTLEIATDENVTLTIPAGTYSNTSLVVNAENAHIENAAAFKNIYINAISDATFVEKANSNTIHYAAQKGRINVAEGAKAAIIVMDGAKKLNVVNDGQITNLAVCTPATLNIEGKAAAAIPVQVTEEAKDAAITSNRILQVVARAKFDLNLLSGAQETEAVIDTAEHMPSIIGVGRIPVYMEDTGDTEYVVAISNGSVGDKKLAVNGVVLENANTPIESAMVYMIPYKAEITDANVKNYIKADSLKATTGEDGAYTVADVPEGNYYLVAVKEDYQTVMETIVLTDEGADFYTMETIYMLKQGAVAKGSLSGVLYNAQDGKPVEENITLRIREGKNNISNDYLKQTTTDEEGNYQFSDLAAGQYTVQVIDYREDVEVNYVTAYFNVVIYAGEANVKNSTISKVIEKDQVRFVLRWGDEASGASKDLDSHLVGPTINNDGEFHTWWDNETYQDYKMEGGTEQYFQCADLDVDDTEWEGPETSTIYQKTEGEYRFYIHDFTNSDVLNSTQLSKSNATVEVYVGNRLKAVYNVPNEAGNLWYVCKYDAINDKLTPVNTMSDWTDDTEYIGENSLVSRKKQLLSVIESAESFVKELTEEASKTEVETLISEAKDVYQNEEDAENVAAKKKELEDLMTEYLKSVEITKVTGDHITNYYISSGYIDLYGDTEQIPEYTVVAEGSSKIEYIKLDEDDVDYGYYEYVKVTGKGGYTKTYYVYYEEE